MRSFRKLSLSTLIAVYVLILVGGIVRSTGSGMGCPDWPRCFGRWVPPTDVSQLPENYKEINSNHRIEKNKRFAKYLSALGFTDTANKILSDESIAIEADFNPVKTWVEYINRLVGVTIGFLIFLVFVFSLRFWNSNKMITSIAALTFILVGFQGWIGSVVVSTNLTPWTITLHMVLAIVIVALLVYLVHASNETRPMEVSAGIYWWLVSGMVVLAVQIVLGTQVREAIDRVASEMAPRDMWISGAGSSFIIHRSFSWIVLLIHAVLVIKIWTTKQVSGFALSLIGLILGTILTGIVMSWNSVPAFLQPIHLVLATATFGMQFLFALRLTRHEVKRMEALA